MRRLETYRLEEFPGGRFKPDGYTCGGDDWLAQLLEEVRARAQTRRIEEQLDLLETRESRR